MQVLDPGSGLRHNVKVVKLLLDEEVDIESLKLDNGQWAPLHLAAQFGHVELAKVLLDKRANIP